jgi:hypothetical protein
MIKPIFIIFIVIITFTSAYAGKNNYSVIYDRKTNSKVFVFKTDRGDVYFNHNLHQDNMKAESCLPCHKSETPTKETTMTRLDERKAHYFCKGCHHRLGKGPIDCHQCHKLNKSSN